MKSASPTSRVLMAVTVLVLSLLSQPLASQTSASAASAEGHARGDISGDWQGTYRSANAVAREVLRISKTGDGEFLTLWYQIENNGIPHLAWQTALQGNDFTFTIEEYQQDKVSYHGKLSANGNSITGTWKQGSDPPAQVELVRATRETAWEIPPGPAPKKTMASDADPSFSVATIKPSDPNAQPEQIISMSGLDYRTDTVGRSFTVRSSTLTDMIAWAYHIHRNQLVGRPKWADEEKFDIAAVQDGEGRPSDAQWRVMMQKLLVDRFQLTFHHDTRELAVYELTVGNGADKLAKSPPGEIGTGTEVIGKPGRLTRTWTATTMSSFVNDDLQGYLGDKPVLDKTGLTGEYDFKLEFAPMPGSPEANFSGPLKADDVPADDLFTALQKQLGLKLKAVKTMADVLLIDRVEQPSPN
jgi:uncharacterized protein (TIGR03435 family)